MAPLCRASFSEGLLRQSRGGVGVPHLPPPFPGGATAAGYTYLPCKSCVQRDEEIVKQE